LSLSAFSGQRPDCGVKATYTGFMSSRVWLSVVVAAALIAGACGDPPDREIQQAQGAIDAARAAGADQFATTEFTAAEDALKRANDAVAQRDYRLALNHALDARERAQNAAKEAADHKATARSQAERALLDAMTALTDAHTNLRAAEAARAPSRVLGPARRIITDAEDAVQKARAAFDRGEYLVVKEMTALPTARLQGAAHDLDAATPAGNRRRR
jgi:hypothetical protein